MSAPASLVEALGSELSDSKGNKIKTEELLSKPAICLYFSADWCPPCRKFKPELAKDYPALKSKHNTEVVFVSRDQDEKGYKQCFEPMPWLGMAFEKDRADTLCSKYKIEGIPSLVVIDPKTMAPLCKTGVESFLSDRQGEFFPWSLSSFLGKSGMLQDSAGKPVEIGSLRQAIFALCFAQAAPPIFDFLDKLRAVFDKVTVRDASRNFTVVAVLLDKEDSNRQQLLSRLHPKWLHTAPEQREMVMRLARAVDVSTLPSMVLVDGASWKVLNRDAVVNVFTDPEGNEFPWQAKPVNELTRFNAQAINEQPCLIVFAEDRDKPAVVSALNTAYIKLSGDAKDSEEEDVGLRFFYALSDPVVQPVKTLINKPDAVMVLLDIPNIQGVFVSPLKTAREVTDAAVFAFINEVQQGTLSPLPLKRPEAHGHSHGGSSHGHSHSGDDDDCDDYGHSHAHGGGHGHAH